MGLSETYALNDIKRQLEDVIKLLQEIRDTLQRS